MTTIVILFLAGVLLLSLEIFLPGGILGVLGALVMLGAVALAFRDFGAVGGMIALAVGLVLGTATVIGEFVILPKTKWGQRMYLSAAVTGVAGAQPGGAELIGRPCEAVTVLAPSGMVLLDGRKHEAFCRDGYAERGATLIVRGSDNFRLIVSKS
jgi:membrane-bound serine protease (ClpP class)